MEQNEKDILDGELKPLLKISYRVLLEDYRECSMVLGKDLVRGRAKRSRTFGALFVLAGIFLLGKDYYTGSPISGVQYVACIGAVLFGFLNLLYYPYLYRSVFNRSTKSNYEKNEYLQGRITLLFCKEYVEERSSHGIHRLPWESARRFYETENQFIIKVSQYGGVFIPKREMRPEEREKLDEILRGVQEEYGKQRTVMK